MAVSAEKLKTMISARWPGEIVADCPMSHHTTLRVGGAADAAAFPKNTEELASLVQLLNRAGVPWYVVGRGSNILVADRGVRGVVVFLGRAFSRIELLGAEEGEVLVRAEAGCGLAKLLRWCAEQEASGLEFLAGIPGSVGGALVMNAGAWGHEISERVFSVEFMDGDGRVTSSRRSGLRFSYRHLRVPENTVVTAGTFVLARDRKRRIEQACKEALMRRQEKQPAGVASAGSFFKNPPAAAAGRLIQDAGLKGLRVGGAEVSPVHANFIVNTGYATARDIFDLMRLVQEKVLAATGIKLEPEVRLIGDFCRPAG